MRIPFWPIKSNKALLNASCEKLSLFRQKSEVLAICAQPTGYSWLGVNVATKSLFPCCTFEMPQYYSNAIFTDKELEALADHINKLNFKQIIWSGFALFYEKIVVQLDRKIKQKVIYHGFLAEFSENPLQRNVFKIVVNLAMEKQIVSIGFVKKGLALSVTHKYNIPTFEIILPNKNITNATQSVTSGKVKIGCLVNTSFRKNLHNMVFAASMVDGVEIHVFKTDEIDYLNGKNIIYHDLMGHEQFINLLGEMTLNLHVTFSESWGQVLSESISLGVPCISANTSSFFDYDEELKQNFVVDGFDDSWYIFKKIESVLSNRDNLSERSVEYAVYLNSLYEERLHTFLNA